MEVVGEGRRGVLFIGEAPGKDEDARGALAYGPAGTHLKTVLRRIGFDLLQDGWKMNAVACRPQQGRRPTPEEVSACRPALMATIKRLSPNVIVLLGSSAISAIIGDLYKSGDASEGRWAGWCIPAQALNAWVCPTWHPVHLEREDDPVLEAQFAAHLATAVAHDAKPWPTGVPDYASAVRRVLDPAKAAAWLRRTAQAQTGAVAFDYETTCLKPDGPGAKIVSCSVAWGRAEPERCIAFPWCGETRDAMGELLRSPVPKIASNLKFEERWTARSFGHGVRAWAWDTMLAAHVLDNRVGVTSVKFQAFVRLGVPVWNEHIEPFLKAGPGEMNKILSDIGILDLLLYNGLDSLLEFRVATDQIREMGCATPWGI